MLPVDVAFSIESSHGVEINICNCENAEKEKDRKVLLIFFLSGGLERNAVT